MSIRKFLLLQASFIIQLLVFGRDGDWGVSKISPALRKNANAVLRLEELHFEINSTKDAVFRNHYVITILDETADHWAEFSEYYNKFREIVSIEGKLYDAEGKELRKLKNKDIRDLSGVDGHSLIEDNRIKEHSFYYKVYPYTVEYDIVIRFKSTLFFQDWVPQGFEKLSVENSRVTYKIPAEYTLRYNVFNYNKAPEIAIEKGKKSMIWSVSDMPAFLREPYQPGIHEITTYIAFAPSEFEVDHYKGSMNNWQDFGKFVYSLKHGRDELPLHIRDTVHRIAAKSQGIREKIAGLYEYMQRNTRYISIQLGIGGWQPFEAKYVAAKGYGDCKALTNFMYSLLKEAGIPSFYTLVRAGRSIGMISDNFPSQQFNHVILCVPLAQDTVWLECTSQTLPAGYLSDFTCDRYGLLIDEKGGSLVRTPKYGLIENLQSRKISGSIDANGTLEALVSTRYRANQQDQLHSLINDLAKDKLMEYLKEEIDLATYDIKRFEYSEEKVELPVLNETLDLVAENYATVSGKRLFIIPNIISRAHWKLKADKNRKFELVLKLEYCESDSTTIIFPEGYIPEAVPQDIKIETKFGKYNAAVKLSGNEIIYYRSYEHYSGRFPASDYADLVKFYDAIYKADRNKVVFVKGQ